MSARRPTGAARQLLGLALAALALLGFAGAGRVAIAQGTLSALQTDVDQIVARARPSVLTVQAIQPASRTASSGTSRRTQSRAGTGVAIDETTVLTTASVVMGADRVVVRTVNGLKDEAKVIGIDPVSNLALLRVPGLRLPSLAMASGSEARVGDWVISVGTSYWAQPTQSVGNIAYRYRDPGQSLLQLTNTVYPGNSGAAALNIRGELIGIVQGELGAPEPIEPDPGGARRPPGASFALPVEAIRPVIESLRRDGRVRHGFLGVTTRAASVASDRVGGESTPIGALVERIVPGGPAQKAGLRKGDLLVAFMGERVEYPEQLARWVASTAPGTKVELVWVRDENAQNGRAVLTESPASAEAWIAGGRRAEAAPARLTELEREVRRLNDELTRLKSTKR